MNDSIRRDAEGRERHPHARGDAPPHETDRNLPRKSTKWNTLSARVIAVVSRKGGVGKTTSAVNLGAALALSGHTVLVVGTDPQCGVCRTLGKQPADLDGSLLDVFLANRSLVHLIQPSPLKNLFFVSPGVSELAEEEDYRRAMSNESDTFVAEIDRARNLYDTILIDCPPSLSPTTRTALLASDSFLVPIQAEELCRESVAPLLSFIDAFRAGFDLEDEGPRAAVKHRVRPPELEGLFLTMVDQRTRMSRYVTDRVREEYGDRLLETSIPRAVRLSEMALRGKPVVIFDRRSASSRAYFNLADELVQRFCGRSEVEAPQPAYHAGEFDDDFAEHEPRLRLDPSGRLRFEAAAGGAMAPPRFGSLHRLLADLGALRDETGSVGANTDDQVPEMVSLDDLLAEEEQGTDGRDDEH